ncbi:PorV/PorQ family protein, partial [Candidatus Poribacteria bacterium]
MKIVFILVSALILTLFCVGMTFAAFDDIGIGARPLGMGGAFVAVSDDANAAVYNPAGLGYIATATAGFTHVRMYSGAVNYNYAAIVLPLGGAGSFGANWGRTSEEAGVLAENSVAFSYSKMVVEALSLGVNLKMLNSSFDSDNIWVSSNPYFAETSASGFTLDLGVLLKPVPGLSIGLSGGNLIPVDISISESEEEKVPVNLRAGVAYRLAAIAASAQQPALIVLNTAIISVEGALREERETNAVKVRAGLEAWFANRTVGLRAGYRMKKVHETSSSAAIGGSIKIPVGDVSLQLDYALQIFGGDTEDIALEPNERQEIGGIPEMQKTTIIIFTIALIFSQLISLASADEPAVTQAVESIGEINARDNSTGTVLAGLEADLILTVIADMSQAEPGEEIESLQITMPSGFTAK